MSADSHREAGTMEPDDAQMTGASDDFLVEYNGELEPYRYADLSDSIMFLPCGCSVEPDGVCPCGNASPLLKVGLI